MMACSCKGDFLMIIKGYVYDEINWAEVIDFFDIITDRISLEMPCIGIRADHVLVVCLNGSFQPLTGTDEFGGHFLLDDLGTAK